jgi:hypothetical protein
MIADHLAELTEMLDRLSHTVEKFWKDHCVNIVRRNGEIAMLAYTDPEGLKRSINALLLRGVDQDGYDELFIGSIEAGVWGCQGLVKDAADELVRQMEVADGEHQAAKNAAHTLKTKIEALLQLGDKMIARRKELTEMVLHGVVR